MGAGAKEKLFLDELEALFTGAEVEGDSGFVNLMRSIASCLLTPKAKRTAPLITK